MSLVLLSIFQVILVVILVALVLLQPPDSSALGGFSNPQKGFSSIVPITSSVNPLGKVTAVVAGLFIINTLLLSSIYSKEIHRESIADKIELENKQKSESIPVPFESE